MSELQYLQTSGNYWSSFGQPSLYGEPQLRPNSLMPSEQHSTSSDFEQRRSEFDHKSLVAEVRRHYVFPQDLSVNKFFSSHRTMPPLLLQAIPRLKDCFGQDAIFAVRAPIDESGAQTLYVVAIWPGSAKSARIALDEFDDVWWIRNSRQTSGNLVFTYELV